MNSIDMEHISKRLDKKVHVFADAQDTQAKNNGNYNITASFFSFVGYRAKLTCENHRCKQGEKTSIPVAVEDNVGNQKYDFLLSAAF